MTGLERYRDRRVLITGAGSGIGQASVLRILAEGGTVVAADISRDGLEDTTAKAEGHSDRLRTVEIDVASEQSVREGVASAVAKLGGLDTLINAAAILRSSHVVNTALSDFEQVIRVNLIGTFLMIREAVPALLEGVSPAVVNFSSTSSQFAHPYMTAYAASKGGVQAMTHAMAMEFSRQGIRFNSVQPGSISSGMTDGSGKSKENDGPGLPDDVDFTLFGKMTPALPLGRAIFGKPEEVAAVVAMLGSTDASFMTGTEIRVDGGGHM